MSRLNLTIHLSDLPAYDDVDGDGHDGAKLRRIRGNNQAIPIITITANGPVGRKMAVSSCVTPFRPKLLRSRIFKACC